MIVKLLKIGPRAAFIRINGVKVCVNADNSSATDQDPKAVIDWIVGRLDGSH
jgi:hypothetical protein